MPLFAQFSKFTVTFYFVISFASCTTFVILDFKYNKYIHLKKIVLRLKNSLID